MNSRRHSTFWNALALVAVALWLAPAVAWECPRTGIMGDSPAAVMALAGQMECPESVAERPAVAKHCPDCPPEPGAFAALPLPATCAMPAAAHAKTCCLAAWMPDARRVAQQTTAGPMPAIRAAGFAVLAPPFESPCIVSDLSSGPLLLQRARAGPSAPRGPPGALA